MVRILSPVVLKKLSGDETIADSSVTVEADTTTPEPSSGISRSLPAGPAAPGDVVVVTINNVGLADGFGDVVETLPAGFSYVDDSAASDTPNAAIGAVVSGQDRHFHRGGGRLVNVQGYEWARTWRMVRILSPAF